MTKGKNLWGGRFTSGADPSFAKFNNSFTFDRRLFAVDVRASVAHCNGLVAAGVLSPDEADEIKVGLQTILQRGQADGSYLDELESEDVHTFVEARLVEMIGDAGRKLQNGVRRQPCERGAQGRLRAQLLQRRRRGVQHQDPDRAGAPGGAPLRVHRGRVLFVQR